MERRLKLHAELLTLADNVYFQPPESKKIKYPCFVYHLNDANNIHADDENYVIRKRYTITYISIDPDEDQVMSLLSLFKYSSFDRWYAADNLNHFVFSVYY